MRTIGSELGISDKGEDFRERLVKRLSERHRGAMFTDMVGGVGSIPVWRRQGLANNVGGEAADKLDQAETIDPDTDVLQQLQPNMTGDEEKVTFSSDYACGGG
jgi:hypothetical protein